MAKGEGLNMSPEHVAMREQFKKQRRKADNDKIRKPPTRKEIEHALRVHGGNITDAATFLGFRPTVLRRRVANDVKLKELQEELMESVTDYAENVVVQQIFNGNTNVAMWWLKTKGKDRGYTEKDTMELEMGEKSMASATELIKAMREGRIEMQDKEELEGGEVTWLPKQLPENHDQES